MFLRRRILAGIFLLALACGFLPLMHGAGGIAAFSNLFSFNPAFYSDNLATLLYDPPQPSAVGACAAPFTVTITSAKTKYPAVTDSNPCGGGNLTNGLYPSNLDIIVNCGSTAWGQGTNIYGGRVVWIEGCHFLGNTSSSPTQAWSAAGASQAVVFEGNLFDNSQSPNQADALDAGGLTSVNATSPVVSTTGNLTSASCTTTVASATGITTPQTVTGTGLQSETRVISIVGTTLTFFPCASSNQTPSTLSFYTIYTPDIYYQNNLIIGMHGDNSVNSLHADPLQISSVGNIYMDKNTFYGNQHALFVVPQAGYLTSVHISRTNYVHWWYFNQPNIASTGSTYTSGTGAVSLSMASNPLANCFVTGSSCTHLTSGDQFTITGITGTGTDLGKLNGNFTATAGTAYNLVNFTIATGLNITSITGGAVSVNSHDNFFYFHDVSGTTYYGTPSAAPAGEPYAPTYLDRVYSELAEGSCLVSGGSLTDYCDRLTFAGVYPDQEQSNTTGARPIEIGGGAYWDINKSLMQVIGGVLPGRPATGDYVQQSQVGTGYQPPGYRN